MAKAYLQHFWDDNYINQLDPIEKLLFLYLLTNDSTSLCGVYKIALKKMAYETGVDNDMILRIFERFKKDKKIIYFDNWICIRNFTEYALPNPNSPKIKGAVRIGLEQIPERITNELGEYLSDTYKYIAINRYPIGIDTILQDKDKDKDKDNNISSDNSSDSHTSTPQQSLNKQEIDEIIGFFVSKIKQTRNTSQLKESIKSCLKDFKKEELLQIIQRKSEEKWFMDNCSWRGATWFFSNKKRLAKYLDEL